MAKKLKDLMDFFSPLRKERGSKYGPFSRDMETVSKITNLLSEWYFTCHPDKASLPNWWACIFFVVAKLVRSCTGRVHEDSVLDGSHYWGQAVTMQQEEAEDE